MKKVVCIFGLIFCASALLIRCSNNEIKSKEIDSTKTKIEALKKVELDTVKKIVILKPEDLKVKIFFKELAHNYDIYYSGEKSNTTGKIRDKKLFQKEKKCTFNSADCTGFGESCHIREVFDNLIIYGKGENISVIILNNEKVIFKKEEIDLKGEIKFSKKDFKLDNTNTKYKIIIKQGKNLLFEGNIDETSQACYHG